jgi:hypothetical protein
MTVMTALAGFLASVSITSGGTFDAHHLETTAVAAGVGLLYKLSGVVQAWLGAEVTTDGAAHPAGSTGAVTTSAGPVQAPAAALSVVTSPPPPAPTPPQMAAQAAAQQPQAVPGAPPGF